MNRTEALFTQLSQNVEQLIKLNEALSDLRHELLPAQPNKFALLAEGPSEDMRRLLSECERLTVEITNGPAAA